MAGTFKSTNPYGTGGALEGQFKPGVSPVQAAVQKAQQYKAATTTGRNIINTAKTVSSSLGQLGKSMNSSSSGGGGSSGGSAGSGSYSGGGSSSYSGGGGGSSSYSGGSGGGGGGGGDVSAASFAPPAPVMEDLTIPDPLADPTYQRQKAELLKARADFDAQQGLAKSQYDGTVNNNMRQMGWREAVPVAGLRARVMGKQDGESIGSGFDPNARGTAYGDSYEGNTGDFAGRGMYNSGLFGQAQGDLLNNFNDRRADVLRDQKDWGDTQQLNQRNFEGQQTSTDLAAQSDAIAAIAARLGVDIGQITPGKENVIQRQKV